MPNTVQLRTPAGDVYSVDASLEDYYRQQGWTAEPTDAAEAEGEPAAAEAEAEQPSPGFLRLDDVAEHNPPADEAQPTEEQ